MNSFGDEKKWRATWADDINVASLQVVSISAAGNKRDSLSVYTFFDELSEATMSKQFILDRFRIV